MFVFECESITQGNFTCVQVIFRLKRRLGYYLFHTYIPTCLIVIMSWISFWIKPEAVPARVTLCVTSLLTLSTQHAQSQKSLPPVSYIKAIDIFMSSCTVFVFASLMEYALVNILMAADERNNHQLNHLLQLSYLNQANAASGPSQPIAHHETCLSNMPRSTSMLLNAHRFTSSAQHNFQLAELAAMQAGSVNDPHNYNGNYYGGRHALYTCACPTTLDSSIGRSSPAVTSRPVACHCSTPTAATGSAESSTYTVLADNRTAADETNVDPQIEPSESIGAAHSHLSQHPHSSSCSPMHPNSFCALHSSSGVGSTVSPCPCSATREGNNNSNSSVRCRTCSVKQPKISANATSVSHTRTTAGQRKTNRLQSSIRVSIPIPT
jgi:hypothetical protein